MRKPRGHFSLDGLFLDLLCIFGIPIAAIAAFVCLLVLKIWCSYSWWWVTVPVGVFIVWLATVQIMSRRP